MKKLYEVKAPRKGIIGKRVDFSLALTRYEGEDIQWMGPVGGFNIANISGATAMYLINHEFLERPFLGLGGSREAVSSALGLLKKITGVNLKEIKTNGRKR